MSDEQSGARPNEPCTLYGLSCDNLPTTPHPGVGLILVTGASGYIGGRLIPELLARGYNVRAMVRSEFLINIHEENWAGADIVVADALKKEHLNWALEGVHTAYYLIHSLLLGHKEFEAADIQAAINFREAALEEGVKRIIYLGGLGDSKNSRSQHLRSRIKVGDELRAGKVPVTTLQAAIIIGSGSAPYEIIRHLASRLPVLPMPHWSKNKCQPIGVRDVIKYLVGVLENEETTAKSFDIGGKDVMTYALMLKSFSEILHKKTIFIPAPFLSIGFYSYFASLLTPVPAQITVGLMEGLRDEVVCRNNKIRRHIQFKPSGYKEAIVRALTREEQDRVYTRWSDSYPPAHELAMKLDELDEHPTFTTSYSIFSEKEASAIFESVCGIGGKQGWFNSNWMWRTRGAVDRMLFGVGSARGRKRHSTLEVNDVIDFWRVEDIRTDRRLLLRAEMKMPGKAWLEFSISRKNDKCRLTITAHFYTDNIPGKVYWYIFFPFHHFIFNDLLEQITSKADFIPHDKNHSHQ